MIWAVPFLSYFFGSIPTGYWIGRVFYHTDIRTQGSGNLGATNVFRVLGAKPGIITLLLDMLKGCAAVFLAKAVSPSAGYWTFCGALAILGHLTSPFVKFKGGKGVATAGGVFAVLLPYPMLFALSAFVLALLVTRMVSLSSIFAAWTLMIASFYNAEPVLLRGAATAIALTVVWTHRANIRRIAEGTENRIAWKRHDA